MTENNKEVPFENKTADEQVGEILNQLADRKERKNHPLKYALSSFLKNTAKKFESGAKVDAKTTQTRTVDIETAKKMANNSRYSR